MECHKVAPFSALIMNLAMMRAEEGQTELNTAIDELLGATPGDSSGGGSDLPKSNVAKKVCGTPAPRHVVRFLEEVPMNGDCSWDFDAAAVEVCVEAEVPAVMRELSVQEAFKKSAHNRNEELRSANQNRDLWDCRLYYLDDRIWFVVFGGSSPVRNFGSACAILHMRLSKAAETDMRQHWAWNQTKGCRFAIVSSDIDLGDLERVCPEVGPIADEFVQLGISYDVPQLKEAGALQCTRVAAESAMEKYGGRFAMAMRGSPVHRKIKFIKQRLLPKIVFGESFQAMPISVLTKMGYRISRMIGGDTLSFKSNGVFWGCVGYDVSSAYCGSRARPAV